MDRGNKTENTFRKKANYTPDKLNEKWPGLPMQFQIVKMETSSESWGFFFLTIYYEQKIFNPQIRNPNRVSHSQFFLDFSHLITIIID